MNPTVSLFCPFRLPAAAVALAFTWIAVPFAAAHGEAGDDVEELREHLSGYAESVEVFLAEIDRVVSAYESGGLAETDPARLVEAWEDARIHAAIELNYAPLYAEIWQGIYGIKEGVENGADAAEVRATRDSLERTLWQSLGAVKMAAKVQEARRAAGESGDAADEPLGGAVAIHEIKDRLDQIVAKSAERDFGTAKEMVHDTYINLFEALEGKLKQRDEALVSAIEKDFNVTLPVQIEDGKPLAEIRQTVAALKAKLDKAAGMAVGAE